MVSQVILYFFSKKKFENRNKVALTFSLILGSFFMVASYPCECYTPIYMTYDELRSSITFKEKKLERSAKIYRYKKLLFINEPNLGLHVYNEENVSNPNKVGFINIPGNVDIAIKNDYLYVDSFIDLVVLDISDIKNKNISEVKRLENHFNYDVYQVFDEDVYLDYNALNKEKGVVIGKK